MILFSCTPTASKVKNRNIKPLTHKGKWVTTRGLPVHPGNLRRLINIGWFLTWPGARSSQHPSFYSSFSPSSPPTSILRRESWTCSGHSGVSFWKVPILLCGLLGESGMGVLGGEGAPSGRPLTPHHCFSLFLINTPHPFFMNLPHIYILDRKTEQLSVPTQCQGHLVLYIMKIRFTRF